MLKRYQYLAVDGIKWTNWFHVWNNSSKEPWQVKNKLKNEYREN